MEFEVLLQVRKILECLVFKGGFAEFLIENLVELSQAGPLHGSWWDLRANSIMSCIDTLYCEIMMSNAFNLNYVHYTLMGKEPKMQGKKGDSIDFNLAIKGLCEKS